MNKLYLILLIAMLLLPITSNAACSSIRTMGGEWHLYFGTSPTTNLDCKLVLATNGNVLSGTCRERDIVQATTAESDQTSIGSRIWVTSACEVRGTLSNQIFVFIIDSARLDNSRNIVTGVGHDSNSNAGVFLMSRY